MYERSFIKSETFEKNQKGHYHNRTSITITPLHLIGSLSHFNENTSKIMHCS